MLGRIRTRLTCEHENYYYAKFPVIPSVGRTASPIDLDAVFTRLLAVVKVVM